MLISLKPDSSNKRIEIVKEVKTIDSSNIKDYAIGMKTIQKKLRAIDTNGDHYESLAYAHMNRPLENLNEDQTQGIQYYQKKK